MPSTKLTDLELTGTLAVTGAITATGGVTGNVTGGVLESVVAVAADGAISVPSANTTYAITKSAAPAVLTIVNPTDVTHNGLTLTIISTTAQAHTLTRATTGFNDAGASGDVATFGGAAGDNIVIVAYGGKWYVKSSVNVTLG